MTIDTRQLQDWGVLGTQKGAAAPCKTNSPKTLMLVISQIELRRSALPKGRSMVCLGSLLLSVYTSVLILFKELVHNQSSN